MEHKLFDHIFQKQLNNLEVSPNVKVWNAIETKLAKKKRRVLPFWWLSGTVAAILVLGVLLYPFLEDENQKLNNNSDEIITTIPEIKSNILDKIDSIHIKDNKVLITKKVSPQKNYKKNGNLLIEEKKITFIQPRKKVKKIILRYHQIDEDLAFKDVNPSIIVQKSGNELIPKKMDLNNFLPKNIPSKEIKSNLKKWSIAPAFAVLKSNSFTNTSPINENLAKTTKGENTYSYGLQVSYKLNEKWTIQSGVHLQEMRYSNHQIAVYNSTGSNAVITEFVNGDSYSFNINSSDNISLTNDLQSNIIGNNGSLIQKFGYLEIPIEIKYNLYNNSNLDTHIVTGFSSLFLNKNEVNLNSDTFSKTLEVNNLNNLNFSGNLGFDFNYIINKNWSFNANPMLKIQLNTFSENANGFAPFNLGIYSGVKFKF